MKKKKHIRKKIFDTVSHTEEARIDSDPNNTKQFNERPNICRKFLEHNIVFNELQELFCTCKFCSLAVKTTC